jgi:hypothetical protein
MVAAAHASGARLPTIANPSNSIAVRRRIKESGECRGYSEEDIRQDKVAAKLVQASDERNRPSGLAPQQALEIFRMDGVKFGGLAVD